MVGVLIGTYTERLRHVDGQGQGIMLAAVDGHAGTPRLLVGSRNPSWLAADPGAAMVHAVSEVLEHDGERGGAVASYEIGADGLRLVRAVGSGGEQPAHVELNPGHRVAYVANYGSGQVAVLPLDTGGAVEEAVQVVQHRGAGPTPVRQERAHPHQALLDQEAGELLVPDLGADMIAVYPLRADGTLAEERRRIVPRPPGSGPRHLALHPDGRHLLLADELAGRVALVRRGGAGVLEVVGQAETRPQGYRGRNEVSAVRWAADGRHAVVSNRGSDSLAVVAFDGARLGEVSTVSAGGREPRDIVFAGEVLLVANQNDSTVVSFGYDPDSGRLEERDRTAVPTPACLLPVEDALFTLTDM